MRRAAVLAVLWLMAPFAANPAAADEPGPSEHQVEMLLRGALADRQEVDAAFARAVAAYDAGDYETARRWWLPLARTDDPAAQRNIAHLYRLGLGIEQNFATAAEWYERAAENGLAGAQANLAGLYLRGQGVEQDYEKAAYWFAAAAAQGNAVAQYNLGLMYLRGLGVAPSEAKAAGWFYAAAKAGHSKSQMALSQLVSVIPEQNDTAASNQTGPDADGTDTDVPMIGYADMAVIAAANHQTDNTETSVPGTMARQFAALGRTLQRVFANSPGAGYEPADARPAPDDVDISPGRDVIADNFELIRAKLRPQAEAGNIVAQYRLARLHLKGDQGPDRAVVAYYWLARAAANGHATAEAEMGLLQRTMDGSALIQAELLLARWRAGQG